jgi:type 1 glutamine amidotransferase
MRSKQGSITRSGALALLGAGLFCVSLARPVWAEDAQPPPRVKTLLLVGGEIHDWKNIGNIVEAALKKTDKYDITRVDNDLDALKADRIEPFDLIVFYWTVGSIKEEQRQGLLNHIAKGKGFVTFHSGADSFRDDPMYRAFVGGYFVTHPAYRTFQVSVTEVDSPITKDITEFMATDEQYILEYDCRNTILANALWKGKLMPVVWTKPWGKGRIFYTGLGHDPKACEAPMFQKLLLRGALWAAGREVTD